MKGKNGREVSMANLYDMAYALGLAVTAPLWLLSGSARRKVWHAWRERMGLGLGRASDDQTPGVLIHAVSVGEVNATRALVEMLLDDHPSLRMTVSVTTSTGLARAQELFAAEPRVRVIRFPLDFSQAVARLLEATRPDVVVLMELEVWPNLLKACAARGIRVMLANGRITDRSYNRYRLLGGVARRMFGRLSVVAAQDTTYATRFADLGVPPDRLRVLGTMKFDTAPQVCARAEAEPLVRGLGLRPGLEPIWVCGSTGPGEEWLILEVYRRLLRRFASLRLVLVPRKPERADEIAQLILNMKLRVTRRSVGLKPGSEGVLPSVLLVDTIGELRLFYAVADVVFVGRSLVDLGPSQRGSDMIEPAAMGRPVVVGPYTQNFAEAVRAFRRADAILECDDAEGLEQSVRVLLHTPIEAASMAARAVEVVRAHRGATRRHAAVIAELLELQPSSPRA